ASASSCDLGDEDDLAELAAGGEALVGSRRVGHRERLGDGHTDPARRDEGDDVLLDGARRVGLLFEGTGAERRTTDDRTLLHEREEVEVDVATTTEADDRDPSSSG